jgi:potassium-transporting ATPase potassium-binding subunit
MTFGGWATIVLYAVVLIATTPLIGGYMHRVFAGERTFLSPVIGPAERLTLRLFGNASRREQSWQSYARSVLVFSALFFGLLYLILRTQTLHPWNPQDLTSPTWDLSFNTTASFVTNTNWQFYGGETTMTYFSQMAGLAVQNFVSAGVGIAVAIAVIRGFASRSGRSLGNFYTDLTRAILYVLLPISIVGALFLISQGLIQTLGAYTPVHTLAGGHQLIARGPVASQEWIKEFGTNGGGFFNVNSAHPFENSNTLTNFVLLWAILAIPAGLTYTFGRMVGSKRQGWAVFAAMMAMFVVATAIVYVAEADTTPAMHAAGLSGANMEGKDMRFGIGSSALFASATTVASCGAVNAAMESLSGFGGAVPMANMMTGEVIFGGVGSGLYGMLLFVLLAVFLAGLMVGRTPHYLGKKIEAREVKLVALGTLAVPIMVLAASALALSVRYGSQNIYNSGPQGFSETVYAYTSQANNNGSAFAGFTGYLQPNGNNSGAFGLTFANILGGFAMLFGRFVPMLLALAVGGALAGKKVAPAGPGTMRTDTPTFVVLIIGTVLLVALLTFVPALFLGPISQGLTSRLF